jgi:hypothetical protein
MSKGFRLAQPALLIVAWSGVPHDFGRWPFRACGSRARWRGTTPRNST